MNTPRPDQHNPRDDGVMTDLLAPLRRIQAPVDLSARIVAACAREAKQPPRGQPTWRWAAYGLAAVLAVLVVSTSFHRPTHPTATTSPAETAFTPEEVGAARSELAWTLEVTGRVFDHTSEMAMGEVFGKRLPAIITRSLHHALTIKPKGHS